MTNTRMRVLAAASLAGAVLAGAVVTGVTTSTITATGGKCLAWLGSRDDGQCIGYSNGSPTNIGTPNGGIGNGGIYSSPLAPGTTFNQGLNP